MATPSRLNQSFDNGQAHQRRAAPKIKPSNSSFESGPRLGCFGTSSTAETERAVSASRGLASEFLNVFFSLPTWRIHPKLSAPMQRMGRHFNEFTDFSKGQHMNDVRLA